MADEAGGLVSQTRYLPFGGARMDVGSIGETDLSYTGQRNIASLGLMDYRARFYDPALKRFTQPDSIVPNPIGSQGWNRYSYGYNNPVKYNDPSGHTAECRGLSGELRSECERQYNNTTSRGPSLIACNVPISEMARGALESPLVGGPLLGPPVGPGPDLPSERNSEPPAVALANGIGLFVDLFAQFSYYQHPHYQDPSWFGSIYYRPDPFLNPLVPIPRRPLSSSDTWYTLISVGAINRTYEPITITYATTSPAIPGQAYDPTSDYSQVYPPEGLIIVSSDYSTAQPGHSTQVLLHRSPATIISPGMSIFVSVVVNSDSGRYGNIVILLTP